MSGAMTAEAEPAAYVSAIEARARRVETPCGDGTMVWRIWGEGEPVVLGHGAQGAWSHWIANIDALAERRMVIAADLPGHGDSALPATLDHAGIAAALDAGLRQVLPGGEPVEMAGFSFSGTAFSHLAARYPERVKRLILIGCGGLDLPHGHVDIKPARGLKGAERRAVLKSNLLGLMLHAPEAVDDLAIHLLEKNARAARLANAAELVIPDRLVAVLPQVKVPVDAIWGGHDRPHPDPAVQEAVIRRSHPETDFRVIADAGHWVMYEQPEAFNAALLDMLG
jgi:pimeloyl-ACP methyl ester carboxylesterase